MSGSSVAFGTRVLKCYGAAKPIGAQIHELTVTPDDFKLLRRGEKVAEIRIDDRNYLIGDTLVLREAKKRGGVLTGKLLSRTITSISWIGAVIPEVEGQWCVLHLGSFKNG